ncbi:MAG: methyl-accepting chemotaxis protein [Clostridiaceae bacterium]|nr:methyl-accepting chemotaxis protein [Clostridiaceae bacterium]
MTFAMVIIEFAGMNLLHWLISFLIPLILIGMALVYRLVAYRMRRSVLEPADTLSWQIDQLQGRSLDHLPAVSNYFHQITPGPVNLAFEQMQQDCGELYQGRWLPDPKNYLRTDDLLSPSQQSAISFKPSARMLAIGLLGALVSALIQQPLPPPTQELSPVLILLPLLTSLAAALLTAADAHHCRRQMQLRLDDLYLALSRHLPVFNDQAGIAMLIDSFMVYDREMKDTLQSFNETAGRLAESDMADGIRRSVEQVLTESVAPPIQQAASTLGRLAGELTNRQEQGMQELASRFAAALSTELAAHMNPINKEIAQMSTLMADVKNYIEYAMRALETVRQQSDGLLKDTRQAIEETAAARTGMAADFAKIDEQLQVMAHSAEGMAALYQGNEQSLAGSLQEFGRQLDGSSRQLSEMVREAIQAAGQARQTAAEQESCADQHISAMREQVEQFSGQLKTDLNQLLEQINRETAAIAGHTSEIGSQMGQINSTLNTTLSDFTESSSRYVQQTLTSFDTGLAEIVERLTHTALEIQDAVDALPAALQQGPRYGS